MGSTTIRRAVSRSMASRVPQTAQSRRWWWASFLTSAFSQNPISRKRWHRAGDHARCFTQQGRPTRASQRVIGCFSMELTTQPYAIETRYQLSFPLSPREISLGCENN